MNQEHIDAVRFLLAVAPAVFRSPRFALKGGTALNLPRAIEGKSGQGRTRNPSTW